MLSVKLIESWGIEGKQLTIVLLNKLMPTSNFQLIRLLDPGCCYKFTYLMANSADPDLQKPTDLDLHSLQRQGISGLSRTRVKALIGNCKCF